MGLRLVETAGHHAWHRLALVQVATARGDRMNQTVTLVTRDASLDDLSGGDYRDIFAEVRERMSLDKFCALVSSQYSKAQWSKYEHSPDMLPTRRMRNELRIAVDRPELPLTLEQATRQASPDAAVWRVGEGTPEHVIMVGSEPVTLHVNFGVTVAVPQARVTNVTTGQVRRKYRVRPWVSESQERRFLALPVRSSWGDVIEAGLAVKEGRGE